MQTHIFITLCTFFCAVDCGRFDLSGIRTRVEDPSLNDRRELQEVPEPVIPLTNATQRVELDLLITPEDGFFSSSALGVFMRCTSPGARIFYTLDGTAPTRLSNFVTYDQPYVHINTPFRAGRHRILRAVATETWIDGFLYRSAEITRRYIVEASERPDRYLKCRNHL